MVDRTRWLLLSLAPLLACDEPEPQQERDLEQACWAYMDQAEACGEGTLDKELRCGGDLYEAEDYSNACIKADREVLACYAELDCETFVDRPAREVPCADVLAAAHESCPEHF